MYLYQEGRAIVSASIAFFAQLLKTSLFYERWHPRSAKARFLEYFEFFTTLLSFVKIAHCLIYFLDDSVLSSCYLFLFPVQLDAILNEWTCDLEIENLLFIVSFFDRVFTFQYLCRATNLFQIKMKALKTNKLLFKKLKLTSSRNSSY